MAQLMLARQTLMHYALRKWAAGLLAVVACASLFQSAAPRSEAQVSATAAAVSVKVVDYETLGKAVAGLKGNVVVVDFWSTT